MIYFVERVKFFVDKKISHCMLIRKRRPWTKALSTHHLVWGKLPNMILGSIPKGINDTKDHPQT